MSAQMSAQQNSQQNHWDKVRGGQKEQIQEEKKSQKSSRFADMCNNHMPKYYKAAFCNVS